MDLTELQWRRDVWVNRNFPTPATGDHISDCILGAVEEIGELAHSYLKMKQGIRGDEDTHKEEMLDSVADCVIFLAGVCTNLGEDYGQVVSEVWERVEQRDWVSHPTTGGEDV